MADNPPQLGSYIDVTKGAQHPRDAIHIAVIQAVCDPRGKDRGLVPGEWVTVASTSTQPVVVKSWCPGDELLGIVDPYLQPASLIRDQTFWVLLMPNTITSLRHEWTHPLISSLASAELSKSKLFVEAFAASINKDYEGLMVAATRSRDGDDWELDNTQAYGRRTGKEWEDFWRHFDIIYKHEGRFEHRKTQRGAPYRCAC